MSVDHRRSLPAATKVSVLVLLALPVVALLLVPTYSRLTPRLWGFPFFYWYQFLWIILETGGCGTAYVLVTRSRRDPPAGTARVRGDR